MGHHPQEIACLSTICTVSNDFLCSAAFPGKVSDISRTFLTHAWNSETLLLLISNRLVLKMYEFSLNTRAGVTVVSWRILVYIMVKEDVRSWLCRYCAKFISSSNILIRRWMGYFFRWLGFSLWEGASLLFCNEMHFSTCLLKLLPSSLRRKGVLLQMFVFS